MSDKPKPRPLRPPLVRQLPTRRTWRDKLYWRMTTKGGNRWLFRENRPHHGLGKEIGEEIQGAEGGTDVPQQRSTRQVPIPGVFTETGELATRRVVVYRPAPRLVSSKGKLLASTKKALKGAENAGEIQEVLESTARYTDPKVAKAGRVFDRMLLIERGKGELKDWLALKRSGVLPAQVSYRASKGFRAAPGGNAERLARRTAAGLGSGPAYRRAVQEGSRVPAPGKVFAATKVRALLPPPGEPQSASRGWRDDVFQRVTGEARQPAGKVVAPLTLVKKNTIREGGRKRLPLRSAGPHDIPISTRPVDSRHLVGLPESDVSRGWRKNLFRRVTGQPAETVAAVAPMKLTETPAGRGGSFSRRFLPPKVREAQAQWQERLYARIKAGATGKPQVAVPPKRVEIGGVLYERPKMGGWQGNRWFGPPRFLKEGPEIIPRPKKRGMSQIARTAPHSSWSPGGIGTPGARDSLKAVVSSGVKQFSKAAQDVWEARHVLSPRRWRVAGPWARQETPLYTKAVHDYHPPAALPRTALRHIPKIAGALGGLATVATLGAAAVGVYRHQQVRNQRLAKVNQVRARYKQKPLKYLWQA